MTDAERFTPPAESSPERPVLRPLLSPVDLYESRSGRHDILSMRFATEEEAEAAMPPVEVDAGDFLATWDLDYLTPHDRKLLRGSLAGLPGRLNPSIDQEWGSMTFGVARVGTILADEELNNRLVQGPQTREGRYRPVPPAERLKGRTPQDLLEHVRNDSMSTLDEAIGYMLKEARTPDIERVIPFGYDVDPSTHALEHLGHQHYTAIKLQSNGGEVYFGGTTIPLDEFTLDVPGASPEARDQALREISTKYGFTDDERATMFAHLRRIRDKLDEMVADGLPLSLTEQMPAYDPRNSTPLRFKDQTGIARNDTRIAAIMRELGDEVQPGPTYSVNAVAKAISRLCSKDPRLRLESIYLPRDESQLPALQEAIAFHLHWQRNQDSCPRAIDRVLETRSGRMFSKRFAQLDQDELLFLATRSLAQELEIPVEQTTEIYGEVNEKIQKYRDRMEAKGIPFHYDHEIGWRTLVPVGKRTMAFGEKRKVPLGKSFSYDAAWLDTDNVKSPEHRKHVSFHEYLHNLQKAIRPKGDLREGMDRYRPTTYVEIFTDWVSHREFPVREDEVSAYRDGSKLLEAYITEHQGSGALTPEDIEVFLDAAITLDFDAVRTLMRDRTGTDLDDLLKGNADSDFYSTGVVDTNARTISS